jgi:excisionase family DNA binding protein
MMIEKNSGKTGVLDSGKLLLSAREAAKVLSVSERTLWSWTSPRGTIPTVRLGHRVLYSILALEQWIAAQAAGSQAAQAGEVAEC